MTALARRLRGHLYREFAASGAVPPIAGLTSALDVEPAALGAALAELEAAHAVVLDTRGEVEWALPFAATSTPYRVSTDGRAWHAPCAWDALAIAPLLGVDTHVDASCPDCGDALRLRVTPTGAHLLESPDAPPPVVHFARAAAEWWTDIRET